MRRIGVISDTHGNLDVIDSIIKAMYDEKIDLWIHAGDVALDAQYLSSKVDVPVVMVRGNCDYIAPLAPEEELISFQNTYIYVTHGHKLNPYQLDNELRWIAKQYEAKLIVTGHTHCHKAEYISDQILSINPGSPTRPRDGTLGTFAIVTYHEEEGYFSAEFIYMEELVN